MKYIYIKRANFTGEHFPLHWFNQNKENQLIAQVLQKDEKLELKVPLI